jgi:hypothetical protein
MEKAGIIGGIESEAIVDYYKGIINAFKADYIKTDLVFRNYSSCRYFAIWPVPQSEIRFWPG